MPGQGASDNCIHRKYDSKGFSMDAFVRTGIYVPKSCMALWIDLVALPWMVRSHELHD